MTGPTRYQEVTQYEAELDELLNAGEPCGDGAGSADELTVLDWRAALLAVEASCCPRCGCRPSACDCGLMRAA